MHDWGHATEHVRRSVDTFVESLLSFYMCVGSGGGAVSQGTRLAQKALYPLRLLADLRLSSF